MLTDHSLLSICIPTYNRPAELRKTLSILAGQIETLPEERRTQIELIVSDNHSPHDAVALVDQFAERLDVRLSVQERNVGPTLNFEHCYRQAKGTYVFILSDDDHLVDGAVADILACLSQRQPDVLFLPFGPQPASPSTGTVPLDRNAFLAHVGMLPTLISACILRRDLIIDVMGRYLDTNMHHYHYFLHAVEHGERFEVFARQMLECPYEHNAGGYNWFAVFGEQLFRIVDEFDATRVDRRLLDAIERHVLVDRIIPTFVNRRIQGFTISRSFNDDSVQQIFAVLSKRCRRFAAYWLMLVPAYLLPAGLLVVMKRGYLRQKSFLFKWH